MGDGKRAVVTDASHVDARVLSLTGECQAILHEMTLCLRARLPLLLVVGLVSSPAPGWPNPRAEACWLRPDLAVGLSSVNHCLDEYSSSSVVKSRVKVVSYR
jgi:hypothetical protein